ncbi:hypothetical protein SMD22_01285 (plasmid) [Brevibacillus halotolerans]|nr:hypothetical protein SMD22_01285 [Brevibacillus halotolerans]
MNITLRQAEIPTKSIVVDLIVSTPSTSGVFELLIVRMRQGVLLSTYDSDVDYPNVLIRDWSVANIKNALQWMSDFDNEYQDEDGKFSEADYGKMAELIFNQV